VFATKKSWRGIVAKTATVENRVLGEVAVAKLGFEWVASIVEASPEDGLPKHAVFSVQPLVDGARLHDPGKSHVFDALSVVSAGLGGGSCDIFTCSCGVAGCAGIHEDVRIEVFGDEVSWVFPERPFRNSFSLRFQGAHEFEVVFDKAQYAQELSRLVRSLEDEAAKMGLPYLTEPCEHPSPDALALGLADFAAKCKIGADEWREQSRARSKAAGRLSDWSIEARLSNGRLYEASLASVGWALCGRVRRSAEPKALESLRPKLLADPAGMVERLSPDVASSVFSPRDWCPPVDWEDEFESLWAGARIVARMKRSR
jgi:hypothetical protein